MSPAYDDIPRGAVDRGVAFTRDGVDHAADIRAIGRTVRERLFGAEDPIGKVIRANRAPGKVVATLPPSGPSISRAGPGRLRADAVRVVMKKVKGVPWLDDSGSRLRRSAPWTRASARSHGRQRIPLGLRQAHASLHPLERRLPRFGAHPERVRHLVAAAAAARQQRG